MYDDAIRMNVKVMDASTFVLGNEQDLTMHIFDVAAEGAMRRICEGEDVGTLVTS
jgi:uridylate kinase